MSLILDPNAKPAQSQQLPTARMITEDLGSMLAQLMIMFRQASVSAFHIHSLAVILEKIFSDPERKYSAAEVQLIAQTQAQKQLEDMKVWLLKQSVPQDKTKLDS